MAQLLGFLRRVSLNEVARSGVRRALVLTGLILLPLCAVITALVIAPPAKVSNVGLDGLNVEVRLRIGQNTNEIDSALLGGLRSRGTTLLGRPVGLDIRPTDAGLNLFGASDALDPRTIDVAGHLFADPQAQRVELRRVTSGVVRYYGAVGLGAGYLVAMIEILGYAYLKHRRRRIAALSTSERAAVRSLLRSQRWVTRPVLVITVLAVVLPAAYAVTPLSDRTRPVQPDPALSGTFLSDWTLTGPFASLIEQAATTVDSLGKAEQSFYDTVNRNLNTQYDTHFGAPDFPADKDVVRLVVLDDLQGTSGMARTVGEAAHRLKADAIVNLGDLTATGTAQEAYLSYLKSYTVGVLTHYAQGIPIVTSLGRHDTPAVVSSAKKEHLTVANGQVQKVAGLPMVGANSPYLVNFGEAARLADPAVTTDTVAAELRDTACAEHPFAVFAHDKELLDPALNSGCVPLVIGGHDYTGQPSRNVTTPTGIVRRIILGSTGGHGEGDGFGGLSTPRNNAPFLVLSIDKRTGAIIADTTVVHPDASVTISSTRLAPLPDDQLGLLG